MGDHIPTTEEVREAANSDGFAVHRISNAEFNSWLRDVQRIAWNRGFAAGVNDQTRWARTGDPTVAPEFRNPYEET